MPDLSARMLAEIERRHDRAFQEINSPRAMQQGASFREMGYLAALREIVDGTSEYIDAPTMYPPDALQLAGAMLAAVAEALGVDVADA